MRLTTLAAALLGVAVLAAGCASAPEGSWVAGGGGNPNVAPVSWANCKSDVTRDARGSVRSNYEIQCGTVKVPQDWAAQGGGATFDVAVIRLRAKRQQDRTGSLLINPGGPGGSGISTALYLGETLPTAITRKFDILGFDPRGVGRSSPVECYSNTDKDATLGFEYDPVDQKQFDDLVALTRKMTDSCKSKYGDRLKFFSTEQTARDMDAIRQAVGDEKLTYLGYSYGTLLGAVYAHLFPKKIRALVLDAAVDPEKDDLRASEGQAAGFEKAFDNLASWCQKRGPSCPIGPDARASVNSIMAKLRAAPVKAADGRTVGPGWAFSALLGSLYQDAVWPDITQALAEVNGGKADRLLAIADWFWDRDDSGRYNNSMEANSAVNCADRDKPPALSEVRAKQLEWRQKYPLFGGSLAMSMLFCSVWEGGHDPYPFGKAEGAPPIVVIGTTGDPATPYEQSGKLADLLGTGTLVTYNGEGHTAYPDASCLVSVVNRYLLEVKAPEKNFRCGP